MAPTTTLPVPIELRLPDGWYAADPGAAGAPGVLFVARHPMSFLGTDAFAANITISGQRRDDGHMSDIAAESVRRLEQNADVRVVDRREVGSRRARGVTQLLTLSTVHDGRLLELVQQQVHLSLRDVEDAGKRAVVLLALTCTPRQYGALAEDFGAVVRTVRPRHE